MPHPHTLTWATPTDHAELADVIFDAVRNGPSKYTEAQRTAWMPERRSGAEWDARLAGKDIIVGRDGARIVGLMSIESGGYIDFAFIRPEAQGTGLFRALFGMVEAQARAAGEQRLWVLRASWRNQPSLRSALASLSIRSSRSAIRTLSAPTWKSLYRPEA